MPMERLVINSIAAVVLAAQATAVSADPEVQALAIATGVLVVYAIATPDEQESSHLAFEVGRFDAVKNTDPATAFELEYRFGRELWWRLRPFIGGGVTSDRSGYGYSGIRLPTFWGEHVAITPSFAIVGYSRGDGKDLGSPPVLGRFGIDLEYRFDNDLRVGVAYHHFSNGKAFSQTTNPGTEIIGITLSMAM
jgi:lipid A 3-O-deacylase